MAQKNERLSKCKAMKGDEKKGDEKKGCEGAWARRARRRSDDEEIGAGR